MPERKDLDLLGPVTTPEQDQELKDAPDDEVLEGPEHKQRGCPLPKHAHAMNLQASQANPVSAPHRIAPWHPCPLLMINITRIQQADPTEAGAHHGSTDPGADQSPSNLVGFTSTFGFQQLAACAINAASGMSAVWKTVNPAVPWLPAPLCWVRGDSMSDQSSPTGSAETGQEQPFPRSSSGPPAKYSDRTSTVLARSGLPP